ncbi:Ig-like domain-containing protein [Nocardioides salsibiostraticola]
MRSLTGVAILALTSSALTACTASSTPESDSRGSTTTVEDGSSSSTTEPVKPVFKVNVGKGSTGVPVDRVVRVKMSQATLTSVDVTGAQGPLEGALSPDASSWTAQSRLEPGTSYQIEAVAEATDGQVVRRTSSFTTQDLSLAEQTYPSVAPLDGETVGVGMPVIVSFDLPVADRAAFEKNMTVTSTPAQVGSWFWMSDNEVHWRPKKYWQAGTEVSVDVDVNGVPAGNGIYGQEDREIDFTVGDANIYRVDARTYEMKVLSNGKLLRTIPVTTGKPGFITRSGTKVIVEKFDSKRMNSETVGIPSGSSEAYDIDNVQWAMRLTYSGEFIHAAPWSVGSQGRDNVSHGCTGLSTADAAYLYSISKRGDVVEYVGTDRPMEPGNGYADWNTSWSDYQAGSAL